jgi:hypothetical protein
MEWVRLNYKLNLGVSKEKAAELFDQYHAKVPFVKQLMNSVHLIELKSVVKLEHYLGRLCRFHLMGTK